MTVLSRNCRSAAANVRNRVYRARVRLCGFAVIRKAKEVFCANNESQKKWQKNGGKCSKCQCVSTPNDFVYLVAKRETISLQWLPWRPPNDGRMSS